MNLIIVKKVVNDKTHSLSLKSDFDSIHRIISIFLLAVFIIKFNVLSLLL